MLGLLIHLDQLRGTDANHLLDWGRSLMHHTHLVKHVLLLRCAEDLLCVFTRGHCRHIGWLLIVEGFLKRRGKTPRMLSFIILLYGGGWIHPADYYHLIIFRLLLLNLGLDTLIW